MLGFAPDLDDAGGHLAWYGLPFAWLLRITLGNLFGEDLRLGRPERVDTGADVDWWTVVEREPEVLVLRSRGWFCGEAWLGFRVSPTRPTMIEQVGSLRTRGVPGMAMRQLIGTLSGGGLKLVRTSSMRRRSISDCSTGSSAFAMSAIIASFAG